MGVSTVELIARYLHRILLLILVIHRSQKFLQIVHLLFHFLFT